MKKRIEDLMDEALKTEPSFQLRNDFKDRVVQIIRKKEKASQRRIYLWMAFGIVAMIGLGIGTISYFMPTMLQRLASYSGSGMEQIVPLAVLIGILILIIQFLDKKLVKDRMLRLH